MLLNRRNALMLLMLVSLSSLLIGCPKENVGKPDPIVLEYMSDVPPIEKMDKSLTKDDYYNFWKVSEESLSECESDLSNCVSDCDSLMWR